MKRVLTAAVVVALVVAVGRAMEAKPFASRLWLELVSDSVWGRCELRITVDERGRGTARSECRYEETASPKPSEGALTPAEVDELRGLLRAAELYSGQLWGMTPAAWTFPSSR